MTFRRSLLTVVLLLCGTGSALFADEATVSESRRHFRLRSIEHASVLYDITEIVRIADEFDETHLLIHDDGHGDFLINRSWSYSDQIVTYRMNDLKDHAFVQHSYKTPFTSKTRRATLIEGKSNPILLAAPSQVKIETNGGQWEGIHTDWDEYGELRRFRHALRQTLDPFLLEALERMRGTVLTLPGTADAFFQHVGRFMVYDQRSDDAPVSVERVDLEPDCGFDKSFGYACSEKQLERVQRAVREHKPLPAY